MKENGKMRKVCEVCGAAWEDGKGFTEEHFFPCINDRYGFNMLREVPVDWKRPFWISDAAHRAELSEAEKKLLTENRAELERQIKLAREEYDARIADLQAVFDKEIREKLNLPEYYTPPL